MTKTTAPKKPAPEKTPVASVKPASGYIPGVGQVYLTSDGRYRL